MEMGLNGFGLGVFFGNFYGVRLVRGRIGYWDRVMGLLTAFQDRFLHLGGFREGRLDG